MEINPVTILLVDDEKDILEFLGYNLKREGYNVITAGTGKKAIQLALEHKPRLIILDVMMPEMDGIETCRELRSNPIHDQSVIVFLTARDEDYSQIAGFEAGADDYIAKPVRPRVLISRVKALLKRGNVAALPEVSAVFTAGNLTIDRERYKVTVDGRDIILPRKEFELLATLASKPNKVFSRDEIFEKVWGNDVVVGDRTIDVHVRKLREKIGDTAIRTVKGVGYTFEA
ncbi:MAG TPA: response regulator transcription factor [Bacteroidales bacterium]|nr:response regulator transcription factor [Bacteroidales bacterium]HRZ47921.1 response regulator transcription factor [Bacteroidales bacterium]